MFSALYSLFCAYVNSENICDFSGFQQAYLAYQTNKEDDDDVLLPGLTDLSPEKLFFVQYAQVWCEISNKEGYRKALLDSHAPGRCPRPFIAYLTCSVNVGIVYNVHLST